MAVGRSITLLPAHASSDKDEMLHCYIAIGLFYQNTILNQFITETSTNHETNIKLKVGRKTGKVVKACKSQLK